MTRPAPCPSPARVCPKWPCPRLRGPLVALEFDLITHGMPPYSRRTLQTAAPVRRGRGARRGAVPATIAVIAGEIRIGL